MNAIRYDSIRFELIPDVWVWGVAGVHIFDILEYTPANVPIIRRRFLFFDFQNGSPMFYTMHIIHVPTDYGILSTADYRLPTVQWYLFGVSGVCGCHYWPND